MAVSSMVAVTDGVSSEDGNPRMSLQGALIDEDEADLQFGLRVMRLRMLRLR